jgi:hypothetical protein
MDKNSDNLPYSSSDKFLDLWLDLENYQSPYAQAVGDPGEIIFPLIKKKSIQSAFISFGAGSIPGFGGIISILPETYLLLKLQARMIKDIAILLGRESFLSKEILLYCLFKESKINLFEASIRITGTKLIVRPISLDIIKNIFYKLVLNKAVKNNNQKNQILFSFISAITNGSISFLDTQIVGNTANSIFLSDIEFEEDL